MSRGEPSSQAVNPLLADAFALYVKTKNFHWHLAGPHFRDYHLLFDEHAEAIFDSIDVMAERVRKIGGTTIRSISHIGQVQTIQDDNNDFVSAEDMVIGCWMTTLTWRRVFAKLSRYATETVTQQPAIHCKTSWTSRNAAYGSYSSYYTVRKIIGRLVTCI